MAEHLKGQVRKLLLEYKAFMEREAQTCAMMLVKFGDNPIKEAEWQMLYDAAELKVKEIDAVL